MSSVPLSLMSDHDSARSLEMQVFQERDFGGDAALRALLLGFPRALEPGLQILEAVGKVSPSARFDILAMDRSRRLVLVEAAVRDADALLLRSLDHYAWALENLDRLPRAHPQDEAPAGAAPRLLLAMPEIPRTTPGTRPTPPGPGRDARGGPPAGSGGRPRALGPEGGAGSEGGRSIQSIRGREQDGRSGRGGAPGVDGSSEGVGTIPGSARGRYLMTGERWAAVGFHDHGPWGAAFPT